MHAQDYVDTMFLAREGEQLFLYQYRTLADGRQQGLIDGAFRIPIDSATAANYVAGQIFQVTQDYWASETRRVNAALVARKLQELDSLSIREFGRSARNITRDAAKADLLTYRVTGADTTFFWNWEIRGAGNAVPVTITELGNGNIRLTPETGQAANITADNVNVLRFNYQGTPRIFFRNPAQPNAWENYNESKGINFRMVRTIHPRASAEFRAQNTKE